MSTLQFQSMAADERLPVSPPRSSVPPCLPLQLPHLIFHHSRHGFSGLKLGLASTTTTLTNDGRPFGPTNDGAFSIRYLLINPTGVDVRASLVFRGP